MRAADVSEPWEYADTLGGRPVRILLDSGAAANFLSAKVAVEMGLQLLGIGEDGVGFAVMPDGTQRECEATELLQLRIGGHREKIAFNVTQLEEHEVILGQSWLRHHNPTTNWQDGRAVLKKGDQEVTLHPIPDPEVANLVSGRGASGLLSAMQLGKAVKKGEDVYVAILRPVEGNRYSEEVAGGGMFTGETSSSSTANPPDPMRPTARGRSDHRQNGARQGGTSTGGTSRRPTANSGQVPPASKFPEGLPSDLAAVLRRYQDVFPDALPPSLPPAREVDHAIELEPGALTP